MSQNVATTCAHNATNQHLIPGRATRCRQCGCQLEPEARAVAQEPAGAPNISPAGVASGYPGEPNA
jgi:hypothetical protein